MIRIFGRGARDGASLSDNRGGPWGPGGGGDDDGSGGDGGRPRNPWGQRRRRPSSGGDGGPNPFEDLLRRGRERFGGGMPQSGRPYWLYGLIAFIALCFLWTTTHQINSRERGVVTTFGYYSRTLGPGLGFTMPWPISSVEVIDVEEIRDLTIPDGQTENLILTGDQNVVNLAYTVRWNIKNPERYLFQISNPEQTIQEVAESAMRAVLARVSLDDALGSGRAEIGRRVQENMQQLLDDYGSGVQIQSVSINQSVPPAAVNDAFLDVSAAQQQAQSAINQARAYALQQTARAEGSAAEFEKIYTQYRAAPEVTRRRLYYETMERILSQVDTTVIEAPGVTPYLPLPEVPRGAPRPAPAEGVPAR
ncbi:MAG: FtsH protease activity modulator HflK [Alphaproteobacteria bacterium]|nr:MAG: FtsH protease activity modulator HflK [Alphaproteobacteria bacterium]